MSEIPEGKFIESTPGPVKCGHANRVCPFCAADWYGDRKLIVELVGALEDAVKLIESCEYGGEPISPANYKGALEVLAKARERTATPK